jgi:F-type H+-transporting ATPase subunit b
VEVNELFDEFMKIWWHIPLIMAMVFVYAFLLNRVLFRPVQKVLADRKARGAESDQLLQQSREQLKRRFDEYEQAVLEAHRRGTHVKEEARNKANEYRNAVLSQVKAEIAAESAKADESLKNDIEAVKAEILTEMPGFAKGLLAKILQREVAV